MPLGGTELLIILAIILLFFGAKRIPELARSLGKGMREFRVEAAGEGDQQEEARRQLAEGENREKASPNGSANRDEKARVPRIEQGL